MATIYPQQNCYTGLMRLSTVLLLYSLIHVQTAWSAGVVLKIGTHGIQATVASTPQSLEKGLMHTKSLCENCGMLFVFEDAAPHGFWMKNTPLPLSIAFIGDNGVILNIADMQPHSAIIHHAQGNARYALEMNRGWFAKRGIKPGHVVRLPKLQPPNKNP